MVLPRPQTPLGRPGNDEIAFDGAKRELDSLDKAEIQYQRWILPCTLLRRSDASLKWRDGLDDWLREHDPEGHDLFRKQWRDPRT